MCKPRQRHSKREERSNDHSHRHHCQSQPADPAVGVERQPLQLRGDPGLPASKTEVIVCPGARLAFIHVYKAAGTTIIASLHDLCQAMGSEARLIW